MALTDLTWIFELVRSGGLPAAIAAGVLAGLALVVIIIARTVGLVSSGKADLQATAFQDRLLRLVDGLTATEDALRRRVDELQGDKLSLQDEVAELRASIALMRQQRRRLIQLMREIKYGQLGPAAIRAAGIELEIEEGHVPASAAAGAA